MRATWVTIHHEGAGAPTDRVSRFLNTDKYSAGIGVSRYELRRSPQDSFITTGQTHHCLQICLSGNRMNYPVTDSDLELIERCCTEARNLNWLVNTPDVKHHGDNGKSACPGSFTNNRRGDIWLACQGSSLPSPQPPSVPGKKVKELMLIEQPNRTQDPVRLACIELRPESKQVIAWNGASIEGDMVLTPGDSQRRGECRVLDVAHLVGNKNIVGWVANGNQGARFVCDGDGGTFNVDFS